MPTAAKLIAAVCFAAVGWFAAHLYVPALPEGTQTGFIREIAAFIGLICGWRILGRLAGRGYGESMGLGLRTSVTIVFWVLVFASIYEMVKRSTKLRYDGPMEAVLGAFDIALGYGQMLANPQMLAVLVLGGIVAGYAAEFAARHWS